MNIQINLKVTNDRNAIGLLKEGLPFGIEQENHGRYVEFFATPFPYPTSSTVAIFRVTPKPKP